MKLARGIMARALLFILTGILVTGADTGAAGTAHFDPGGIAFCSTAMKARRGWAGGLRLRSGKTRRPLGQASK
jgi:hypothetical protein